MPGVRWDLGETPTWPWLWQEAQYTGNVETSGQTGAGVPGKFFERQVGWRMVEAEAPTNNVYSLYLFVSFSLSVCMYREVAWVYSITSYNIVISDMLWIYERTAVWPIQIHSKSIKILYLFGKKNQFSHLPTAPSKEASYLSPLAGVCPQGGPVDLRLEVTTETGTQGGNGLHWSWRTDESGLVGIQRTTPHQVSGFHLGCTLVKWSFFFRFSPESPVVFWGVLFGGVVYVM